MVRVGEESGTLEKNLDILAKQMEKDSRKVIELAVSRMLPKNKLREPRLNRLKVFPGSEHIYKDKFNGKA